MIDLVASVLRDAGITRPPVRLPLITASLGIRLRASERLPPGWHAALIRHGERSGCFYDPMLTGTRIRSSIAHEIGHALLHRGRGIQFCEAMQIPVDEVQMDREADAFAAELLMPTAWMLSSWAEHPSFDDLRDLFWVSKQGMHRRLGALCLSVPFTTYDTPFYASWDTLGQTAAMQLYPALTADPYGEYLEKRGVLGRSLS